MLSIIRYFLMRQQLDLDGLRVSLEPGDYPRTWKISNTLIHLHEFVLSPSRAGVTQLQLDHHEGALKIFIADWLQDRAMWYRGFAGCHWTWEAIKGNHAVVSEGSVDEPLFTMNKAPGARLTRWLPGDILYETAYCAALQCMEQLDTSWCADDEALPVSGIIQARLGPSSPVPICIMPGSEAQLRGPLYPEHYELLHLLWRRPSGELFTTPCARENMPPVRPFMPSNVTALEQQNLKLEFDRWHNSVMRWKKVVWDNDAPMGHSLVKFSRGNLPYQFEQIRHRLQDIVTARGCAQAQRIPVARDFAATLASCCSVCNSPFGPTNLAEHCHMCGKIVDSRCLTPEVMAAATTSRGLLSRFSSLPAASSPSVARQFCHECQAKS